MERDAGVLNRLYKLVAHTSNRNIHPTRPVCHMDQRQHGVEVADQPHQPLVVPQRVGLRNHHLASAAHPCHVCAPTCQQTHIDRCRLDEAQSAQLRSSAAPDGMRNGPRSIAALHRRALRVQRHVQARRCTRQVSAPPLNLFVDASTNPALRLPQCIVRVLQLKRLHGLLVDRSEDFSHENGLRLVVSDHMMYAQQQHHLASGRLQELGS
eukprot:2177383-Prymnesium_polylepis.1